MKKLNLIMGIVSLALWTVVAIFGIVYWINGWKIDPALYTIATLELVVLNLELLGNKINKKGDK